MKKTTMHAHTSKNSCFDTLELGGRLKKHGLHPVGLASAHALEVLQQVQHKHAPALADLDK